MKASTKTMSSAKATTRHAIRAITGDVNTEKEMVGLVNSAIGSDVEQFISTIACSCTLVAFYTQLLTKAMWRSQYTIGLIPEMLLAQVPYIQKKQRLFKTGPMPSNS